MVNKIRDYGFATWLQMIGHNINDDLTIDMSINELKKLNDQYKQSTYYTFNISLRKLVKRCSNIPTK